MDKEKLQDMNEEEQNGCGCHEDHDGCGCGDNHEGCGCGCEDEALIVDLEDENGNIVPCEMVDKFSYKDNEYVLVQNPEDDSIYLFKVVGNDEESELVVPEDEEFEEVSSYYEGRLEKEEE